MQNIIFLVDKQGHKSVKAQTLVFRLMHSEISRRWKCNPFEHIGQRPNSSKWSTSTLSSPVLLTEGIKGSHSSVDCCCLIYAYLAHFSFAP